MGLPGHHHTSSKKRRRRSHLYLKAKAFQLCSNCKSEILAHRVCYNCGFYKGKQVIDVLAKLDKKERKNKEKELALKEKEKGGGASKPLSAEELSKK